MRIIENLPEKSGHPLAHWFTLLAKAPKDKKAQMVFLKLDHGIGHHTAGAIVREFHYDVPWCNGDELEAELAEKFKGDAQRLYSCLKCGKEKP